MGGFDSEILELVPDERIVLRWQFVGPDRSPLAEPSSRLTITLGLGALEPGGARRLSSPQGGRRGP